MDTPNNQHIFVSMDGDSVGNLVGRAALADDVESLNDVSIHIEAGKELIRDFVRRHAGPIISAGGDEINARLPLDAVEEIESLRTDYSYIVKATLSVGVGEKLSQSSKALMVAKLRGKNQILQYAPDVEDEWTQSVQNANVSESQKIGNAYMKKDPQESQKEQLPDENEDNSPNEGSSSEQDSQEQPQDG